MSNNFILVPYGPYMNLITTVYVLSTYLSDTNILLQNVRSYVIQVKYGVFFDSYSTLLAIDHFARAKNFEGMLWLICHFVVRLNCNSIALQLYLMHV